MTNGRSSFESRFASDRTPIEVHTGPPTALAIGSGCVGSGTSMLRWHMAATARADKRHSARVVPEATTRVWRMRRCQRSAS